MADPARPVPQALTMALVALEGCALVAFELGSPLRARRDDPLVHLARNAVLAALALGTTAAIEAPLAARLARLVARRRWGLTARLPVPAAVRAVLAVGAMDYTMYLWHRLAHRAPVLWRFHQVHHVERGLDASSALRFHAGEQLLSVPWRLAQVLAIGTTPLQLTIWQTLFLASILFHHSNVRLPVGLERMLRAVIVTPPLHGIHHGDAEALEHANLSSGLTIWDRLHGSYRADVPQSLVTIGLPAYPDESAAGIGRSLGLPFGIQADAFTAPA